MARFSPSEAGRQRAHEGEDVTEDSMNGDLLRAIPPGPYERWFDICFRLIILALAGFWLLMPPAGAPDRPVDLKAAVTTR